MKKRTGIFAIIIAILLLGVGYAAMSGQALHVNNAKATVKVDDSNFNVIFRNETTFSKTGAGEIEFDRTDDHNVTFTLTGFTKRGDTAVITLPFRNDSDTLQAVLENATVTNSDGNYFRVTAEPLTGTVLGEKGQADEGANLVITVEAIKTPVENDVTTTITATLNANPKN